MLTTILKPKIAKAKYSGAAKVIAIFASCGATNIKTMTLKSPPIPEEITDAPKAFPAFPF
ncbi:hypothetical protein ES708_34072 [subsurface metagenome]